MSDGSPAPNGSWVMTEGGLFCCVFGGGGGVIGLVPRFTEFDLYLGFDLLDCFDSFCSD